MGLGLLIIQSLYLMLPCYLANSSPVLSKNMLKSFAKPVDFGVRFRGKPLLGTHKTWRGLLFAVVVGMAIFFIQKILYRYAFFQNLSIIDYNIFYSRYSVLPGFLLGFGAMFGDMVKSFFKRQFDIKAGDRWIPFDQIDFIIGALVFLSFIYIPSWQAVLILLIFTPLIHITANHVAFYLKIRKEKW